MTKPIILSNEADKPEVKPVPNTPEQGKPLTDTPPSPANEAPKNK